MSYDGTSRAVSWKIEGNTFNMDLVIPPNTAATVFIPAKDAGAVKESGKAIAESKGIQFLRMDNNKAVYIVESGHYAFTAN